MSVSDFLVAVFSFWNSYGIFSVFCINSGKYGTIWQNVAGEVCSLRLKCFVFCFPVMFLIPGVNSKTKKVVGTCGISININIVYEVWKNSFLSVRLTALCVHSFFVAPRYSISLLPFYRKKRNTKRRFDAEFQKFVIQLTNVCKKWLAFLNIITSSASEQLVICYV